MSTDELTEDDWREATTYDLIDWHQVFRSEEERDAAWNAWLARVRRAAAREALDGLADEEIHVNWEMDGPSFALRVRRFKGREYPEETP